MPVQIVDDKPAPRHAPHLADEPHGVVLLVNLHAGAVQSKARLTAALWDDEIGPESNVLEVLISKLRRKVDGDSPSPLIHTRRGAGYVVCEAPGS